MPIDQLPPMNFFFVLVDVAEKDTDQSLHSTQNKTSYISIEQPADLQYMPVIVQPQVTQYNQHIAVECNSYISPSVHLICASTHAEGSAEDLGSVHQLCMVKLIGLHTCILLIINVYSILWQVHVALITIRPVLYIYMLTILINNSDRLKEQFSVNMNFVFLQKLQQKKPHRVHIRN